MQPPAFWHRPPATPGWQALALAPLARVYAAATARRAARLGRRAPVPVICVGNINVGGTGKTPTVIDLLERIRRRGLAPHVITRGYGGTQKAACLVDPARHGAGQIGDEPLLLAEFTPVWVGSDRSETAGLAAGSGADVIVMDDGFQSPDPVKDLSIVVVDAQTGFGNGRVIPAGPLRERVGDGLARADLLLSIGGETAQERFSTEWGAAITVPRVTGRLEPLETGMAWSGLKTLPFAGIGRPQKFFDTLAALGADIVRSVALDDHQKLGVSLLTRLEREAATLGAQLVTTEKDAVRLPTAFRQKVLTLPVRLRVGENDLLERALDELFQSSSRSSSSAAKSS